MKSNPSLKHILRMTDKIGILEHSVLTDPQKIYGYTVDDNARALQVILKIDYPISLKNRLAKIYLDFILSAKTENGFHNDLNKNLKWDDKPGFGDWFGRAMEALLDTGKTTLSTFDDQLPLIKRVKFPRTKAHLIIALCKRYELGKQGIIGKEIINLCESLLQNYKTHSHKSWRWFENILTYNNAVLPMSLFYAFESTSNAEYLKVAEESLNFLIEKTYDKKGNYFSFPGNKGWVSKTEANIFDQQPIEAGTTVELLVKAYQVTKNKKYADYAKKALAWYSGKNILKLSLLDLESGGVKDGITKTGINQNEGAESILGYCLAVLAYNSIYGN